MRTVFLIFFLAAGSLLIASAACLLALLAIAEDVSHSQGEQRYFCFGRVGDGILTVREAHRQNVIRIFGAGYWRKGKNIYEQENNIH